MATIRSPRARHRRVAVNKLRDVKANVAWLIDRWAFGGRSTVWVAPADRKPGENVYKRPRQAHEYPEMQSSEWLLMANAAEMMILELRHLAQYARNQATEVAE